MGWTRAAVWDWGAPPPRSPHLWQPSTTPNARPLRTRFVSSAARGTRHWVPARTRLLSPCRVPNRGPQGGKARRRGKPGLGTSTENAPQEPPRPPWWAFWKRPSGAVRKETPYAPPDLLHRCPVRPSRWRRRDPRSPGDPDADPDRPRHRRAVCRLGRRRLPSRRRQLGRVLPLHPRPRRPAAAERRCERCPVLRRVG